MNGKFYDTGPTQTQDKKVRRKTVIFLLLVPTGVVAFLILNILQNPYGPINMIHMMISPKFFHDMTRSTGTIFAVCLKSQDAQYIATTRAENVGSENSQAYLQNYNTFLMGTCLKISTYRWLHDPVYKIYTKSSPEEAAQFAKTHLKAALLDYVTNYNSNHGNQLTLLSTDPPSTGP